jgi:hypothetical protein
MIRPAMLLVGGLLALAGCQPLAVDPELYDPAPAPAAGYQLSTAIIPTWDELTFRTTDDETLYGVWVPARSGRPDITVVYLHGEGENVGTSWPRIEQLHGLGVNVMAVDLRGYGRSTGYPNERGLRADLAAIAAGLGARPFLQLGKLAYYGRSLGAAFAVELARHHQPAAMVLEAPFTSVQGLVNDGAYVDLPRSFVARSRWDNLSKIAGIEAPLLVLHGEDDRFAPPHHGRALVEAHPGRDELVLVPGAGHHDVREKLGDAPFRTLVGQFVIGAIPR